MNGKGDRPRPADLDKYEDGWSRIFAHLDDSGVSSGHGTEPLDETARGDQAADTGRRVGGKDHPIKKGRDLRDK